MWGAKPPTFLNAFPGPRGPPDPPHETQKIRSEKTGPAAETKPASQEGAVKKTVDKIQKDQKSMRDKMLAQAAKNCKKVAGVPVEAEGLELGFPAIAADPEDY